MLLTNFENFYRKIFNSIDNPSLNSKDIEHIIDSDCSISYSPTSFCILNSETFAFDYISKNMHSCLGIKEFLLEINGLKYIWSRIHPQDIDCLLASFNELLKFIETHKNSKKNQLSYSWNYRFKKEDGTYLNIIQNTTPFCFGEKKIKKGLTHFTVVNSQLNMPIRASVNLLNPNGDFETKYTNNCSQGLFFASVSKREKDIIKLLVKERSSKAIAKKLFISSNTVDTHRRNILKKLKLSSTGELINILKTQQHMF